MGHFREMWASVLISGQRAYRCTGIKRNPQTTYIMHAAVKPRQEIYLYKNVLYSLAQSRYSHII